MEQRGAVNNFKCMELRQFGGIYMMTSCPHKWRNQKVRAMCEREDEGNQDPLSGLPVTSHVSQITYRNPYCAICHGEKQVDFWKAWMECPTIKNQQNLTSEYIKHVKFNTTKQAWGIMIKNHFHTCKIYPYKPESSSHIVRKCVPDLVKSCAVNWTNAEVRERCEAYTTVVYNAQTSFRNPHCAMCNNVPVQEVWCRKATATRSFPWEDFNPTAFSILFDVSGGDSVGKKEQCKNKQLYDPFFNTCRDIFNEISVEAVIDDGGVYEIINNDQVIFPDSPLLARNAADISSCPKFTLNAEDFVVRNGTIFVPKYKRTFYKNEFTLRPDGTVDVCANTLTKRLVDKFGVYMGYVTFTGLGVSIIFLILHLVAFVLVAELRNLSGKNLASFCFALLMAYCFFMLGQITDGKACFIIAILTYYSFLSSFSWMLTMSFDVWRTLRLATAELRVTAGKQWRKFIVYSVWSWLVPAFIVLASLFVEQAPRGTVARSLRPEFGVNSCWFGQRKALLLFFALPVAVVMVLNFLFFCSAAHMIYSATSMTRFTASAGTQRDFRLYARLALVMGLTWTVGLVAGYLDNEGLWYAFIALNTLQGLFIFLAFTCTNKVIRALVSKKNDVRPLRPPSFSWSGGSSDSTKKTASDIGSGRGTSDTLY